MSNSLLRRKAEMVSVRLTQLHVTALETGDDQSISLEFKVEGRMAEHEDGSPNRSIELRLAISSPNRNYYEVEAVAEASFHFDEDADDSYIASYMNYYAPNEVVGFLRSTIAAATASFSHGSVEIPGFNIVLSLAS